MDVDKGGPAAPVMFIDNPHAPEVFASEATGFSIINGNLAVTLESTRINHGIAPSGVNRVVIARIVMPIESAQRLALSLYDFLVQRGMDPAGLVRSEEDSERPQ